MPKEIMFTLQTFRVMGIFCKRPEKEFFGSDISMKTNLPSGTIYPLLGRLEAAGFVKSVWEKGSAKDLKRPLKHFYTITEKGKSRYLFEILRNP